MIDKSGQICYRHPAFLKHEFPPNREILKLQEQLQQAADVRRSAERSHYLGRKGRVTIMRSGAVDPPCSTRAIWPKEIPDAYQEGRWSTFDL